MIVEYGALLEPVASVSIEPLKSRNKVPKWTSDYCISKRNTICFAKNILILHDIVSIHYIAVI